MNEQGRSMKERRELDDIEEVIVTGVIATITVALIAWAGWTFAKWIAQ